MKFEVTWRPGKRNSADFSSRHAMSLNCLPQHVREEANEFNKLCWLLHGSPYIEAISVESLQRHTDKDAMLMLLKECIRKGKKAGTKVCPELRTFTKVFEELTISDGGLIMRGEQVVLPHSLICKEIEKAHQGGHPGESSLKHRLRMHFWCSNLNKAISNKVKACLPCQAHTHKPTKEPQAMLQLPRSAWDKVSLD